VARVADAGARWWSAAVVQQVYLRSFADSSGDGVGDLAGLRSRLPYLAALGVDAVWVTPHYESPQEDHGYDVADPRAVDPLFGTLADVDALVAEAHGAGLRVLLDLVPNHTSRQRQWFVDALAAAPGSRERARYLFRDGRGPGGDEPPNDWGSVFGGPGWERVVEADGRPGQWYLHLFAPGQPDLDWSNEEVRADAEQTLRFWLDRGIDGFRVDVAHGLVKADGLPDDPFPQVMTESSFPTHGSPQWDQPGVHEVYRRWRRLLDSYGPDRVLVGELWVRDPERHAAYVRPDELHLAFAFQLLEAEFTAAGWREAIGDSLAATASVGSPVTWVLGNHDVVRMATRLGSVEASRAAQLAMLALPGPAFLYAGDELGLPEVDVAPAHRQDPIWERSGHTAPGRDGCRVPLPWNGSTPPFGFTTAATAWLPQPATWAALTVEAQEGDPLSTLVLVRGALAVRRALLGGPLAWREGLPDGVLGWDRVGGPAPVTCVLNPTAAGVEVALAGRLVLASAPVGYDGTTLELPPTSCAWLSPA